MAVPAVSVQFMAVLTAIRFVCVELALILPDVLVVAAQVFALLRGSGFIAVFTVFGQCAAVLPAFLAVAAQFPPILAHIAGVLSDVTLVLVDVLGILLDVALSSVNGWEHSQSKRCA
jgi:uncharacterized membrane protein